MVVAVLDCCTLLSCFVIFAIRFHLKTSYLLDSDLFVCVLEVVGLTSEIVIIDYFIFICERCVPFILLLNDTLTGLARNFGGVKRVVP